MMNRQPEIMDRPDLSFDEAESALADIGKVHRWIGIGALERSLLPRLARGRRRLLDLGTGRGEVCHRLADRAKNRGIDLEVVGIDRKLAHLVIGRDHGFAQRRVVARADQLPFRTGSFDASCSTLFFHHFDGPENRQIVDEMRRVSGGATVVVDIRRSRLGTILTDLFLSILRLGPVAAFDGRLSARQAWTTAEVRALVADLPGGALARRWPFRFSLVLAGSGQEPS